MNSQLDELIEHVEKIYGDKNQRGGRHYMEVNLAEQARLPGHTDGVEKYRSACAIIPRKDPQHGMKVRIDGRTFVNDAEYESGVAIPGCLGGGSRRPRRVFVPNDSMICNFC